MAMQSSYISDENYLYYKDLKLDLNKEVVWKGDQALKLFHGEFKVLEYFIRNQGRIISNEELFNNLWDGKSDDFAHTVYIQVSALRRKLGDKPGNPLYIERIVRQGYRLGASTVVGKASVTLPEVKKRPQSS